MTATSFRVGDKVCRTGEATVGEVVQVGRTGEAVRVAWPTRRIGGAAHRTWIAVGSLTPAGENVARVRTGPADADWQVSAFAVDCDHPSGQWMNEYDVNAFRFGASQEADALAKAAELAAAGRTNVRVNRQDRAEWVPAGCRTPRQKCRWTRIA